MSSDACTHNMQAPEERGVATAAPFPAHLARPSNIPRFADAQVTPPCEGTLVEELSRVLANKGRFGTSREHI